MIILSDDRLAKLLATVTIVGKHRIPPNTPCFWDTEDRVACTYNELESLILELQKRRKPTP